MTAPKRTKVNTIVGFLEGMYYVGKCPSLAEVGDITAYLRRKGMVDGTETEVETLVHAHIGALHMIWGKDNKEASKNVLTSHSINKADELNRKIYGKTAHVYWQERLVVRAMALEGDMIRLFFELGTTNPEKYTDVPYTEQLRITR